jgi:hypothetical protein
MYGGRRPGRGGGALRAGCSNGRTPRRRSIFLTALHLHPLSSTQVTATAPLGNRLAGLHNTLFSSPFVIISSFSFELAPGPSALYTRSNVKSYWSTGAPPLVARCGKEIWRVWGKAQQGFGLTVGRLGSRAHLGAGLRCGAAAGLVSCSAARLLRHAASPPTNSMSCCNVLTFQQELFVPLQGARATPHIIGPAGGSWRRAQPPRRTNMRTFEGGATLTTSLAPAWISKGSSGRTTTATFTALAEDTLSTDSLVPAAPAAPGPYVVQGGRSAGAVSTHSRAPCRCACCHLYEVKISGAAATGVAQEGCCGAARNGKAAGARAPHLGAGRPSEDCELAGMSLIC